METRNMLHKNPIYRQIENMWYYHVTGTNRLLGTVCLIKDTEGKYHRGVTICSFTDVPDKKEGKTRARNRAIKAFATKSNILPVNTSLSNTKPAVRAFFDYEAKTEFILDSNNSSEDGIYKGLYNIIPTVRERKIIGYDDQK